MLVARNTATDPLPSPLSSHHLPLSAVAQLLRTTDRWLRLFLTIIASSSDISNIHRCAAIVRPAASQKEALVALTLVLHTGLLNCFTEFLLTESEVKADVLGMTLAVTRATAKQFFCLLSVVYCCFHHLFAQYAEMNSKICNVPDRKANSFSSNNCP